MKQEVLSLLFEESNKTFGVKNKPRTDQPSMFDMLSWQDKEQPWDFKKKNINPDRESEVKKYPIRIAHDTTKILTEAQDNYRKITKLQNGDLVQDINNGMLKTLEKQLLPTHQMHPSTTTNTIVQTIKDQVHMTQSEKNYRQQADYDPKIQSVYRDQYQVKDIKNQKDLLHQLELNSMDNKGHFRPTELADDQAPQQEQEQEEEYSSEEEQLESASAFNSQKKMSTRFTRKAKRLDPNDPEDAKRLERRRQRIKAMRATTRFMPDTAFTTYFGKPAFGPYGYGNVTPTIGGIMYGQHMLSHNVQPHRTHNHPQYAQSYRNALRFSQAVCAEVVPEPPRNCKEEDRLNPQQIESLKQRNPLTALPIEQFKKTITDSKGRVQASDLNIKKPDLVNSLRFASEEGSVSEAVIAKPTKKKENMKQTRPRSAAANKKMEPGTQQMPKKKKVGFKNAKEQPQSERKVALDDSLTMPDKSQNKFIDEIMRKKEKANRLTGKVNEVNPSMLVQSGIMAQSQHTQSTNQIRPHVEMIDDMNPPHLYLQQLQQEELNPKYSITI